MIFVKSWQFFVVPFFGMVSRDLVKGWWLSDLQLYKGSKGHFLNHLGDD